MVPVQIIFSPETYQKIINEHDIQQGIDTEAEVRSTLESHFSIPIIIKEEDTDVIIAKELYPNPCPICGRRIPFLREMIQHLESRSTNRVRCPLGHRYEGRIKIYHVNILQQTDESDSESVQTCPQCGSQNIQYLSQTDVFCLDCEWDNLNLI